MLLINSVQTHSLLEGQLLISSILAIISGQISWGGHEYHMNVSASHQFCKNSSKLCQYLHPTVYTYT